MIYIGLSSKEVETKKIGLTHWGYFEPWDSYRNYIVSKEFGLTESLTGNSGTFTNFAQNDQAYLHCTPTLCT